MSDNVVVETNRDSCFSRSWRHHRTSPGLAEIGLPLSVSSLVLRLLSTSGLAGRNDSDAIAPSRVNDYESPSKRPDANRHEALLFRIVVRHRQHSSVLEHGTASPNRTRRVPWPPTALPGSHSNSTTTTWVHTCPPNWPLPPSLDLWPRAQLGHLPLS